MTVSAPAAPASLPPPSRSLVLSIDELAARPSRVAAASGVYTFVAADDRALYVGKSIHLRNRLASYLQPSAAVGKVARMMRVARRVRIERCGSELAALLREAELVQELRPPFNRRMAKPEGYFYVRVDYGHTFPRVAVVDRSDEDAHFLGPFFQRRKIERAVEALNDAFALRTCDPMPPTSCWRADVRRCLAPCVEGVRGGEYGRNLLLVREALAGRAGVALRKLTERRDALAAEERFEAAAAQQRRIEAIRRLRATLFASQAATAAVVAIQPGVRPGEVQLWGIRGGDVGQTATVGAGEVRSAFESIWTALQGPQAAARPVAKLALDRRCIVHRWLRSPAGAECSVPVSTTTREQAWARVDAISRVMMARLL